MDVSGYVWLGFGLGLNVGLASPLKRMTVALLLMFCLFVRLCFFVAQCFHLNDMIFFEFFRLFSSVAPKENILAKCDLRGGGGWTKLGKIQKRGKK